MKALLVSMTLLVLMLFAAPSLANVESGSATGTSRAAACDAAKRDAAQMCSIGRQDVRRYGSCECSGPDGREIFWTCTVDAYCKDRGATTASILSGMDIPSPLVSITP